MKQTISRQRVEELIRECQLEAEQSIREGNPPFGCVITDPSGTILVKAHNTQETDTDPTAHAEINALRQLGKLRKSRYLDDCIVFANAESCSMCISAAIKARISTFYFGAASEAKMNPWITVRDVAAKVTTPIEIHSPILGEECAAQIARGRETEAVRRS